MCLTCLKNFTQKQTESCQYQPFPLRAENTIKQHLWMTPIARIHHIFPSGQNRLKFRDSTRRWTPRHRLRVHSSQPLPIPCTTQKHHFPRHTKRSTKPTPTPKNRRLNPPRCANRHKHVDPHPQKNPHSKNPPRHNHNQNKLRSPPKN